MMKKAGRITGEAILAAAEHIRDGVTTKYLDAVIRGYIEKCGATPSFLGYGGFPASACISLNDEVIHGIPSENRVLHEGDIVKLDVGACFHGYHGDSARTFPVGHVSKEAQELIDVTETCFYKAFEQIKVGNRIGDLGAAVSSYAEGLGYGVVRRYVGHGVGHSLHEDPEVPNFGTAGHGPRILAGMTIAVEPMINAGTRDVIDQKDGWTVKTADGKLSAHYEHSIAVLPDHAILLTKVD